MRLTQRRLKQLMSYDRLTGEFRRVVTCGRMKAGSLCGTATNNGYVSIQIDGKLYKASRLAVFYVKGRWPKEDVDHANRDRADNRWGNLREASRSQNNANSKRRRNNTSGVVGVGLSKGRWRAYVGNRHIGTFAAKPDAVAARNAAAIKQYGEFLP